LVALGDGGKLDLSVIHSDAVNQNAFSNVVVKGISIEADCQTDTLELAAGTNIELTADAINEKVTIAVTGKVVSAVQADSATKLATSHTINGVAFDGAADITITAEANGGNADTVDGKHAADFAAAGYIAFTSFGTTSSTGGDQAHNNMPPYYALAYIMRIA